MEESGTIQLALDDRPVILRLRRSERARRVSLRIDPALGEVVVVLPSGADPAEGLRFASEKSAWIGRQIDTLPPRVPFAEGATVPYRGAPHVLRRHPGRRAPPGRGPVWRSTGEIWIAGDPAHFSRRVRDWLIERAREILTGRAHAAARVLDRPVARLAVRDPKSRWGSCTADGRLSFSWRLVLAPEGVLDYVTAHEVAHLVEMRHNRRFWALVEGLCDDHRAARAWLAQHGPGLHRYG